MILQALYNYYQRKAADPESRIAPHGFEWKEIPFLIVIDKEGNFLNIEDTRSGDGNNKIPETFLVVKRKGRPGSNAYQIANVLWDHYGYVLAFPKEKDDKKSKDQLVEDARKQHASFVLSVNAISEKFPDNLQFDAVKRFLTRSDQLHKVFEDDCWSDCKTIPGCNFSFRLAGGKKIVAEDYDLKSYILSGFSQEDTLEYVEKKNAKGVCLITGEYSSIAILHTATSISGGNNSAKLVGFQKNSGYNSYYKEQGLNAPVSLIAEDAYTTALNYLLSRESNNKFRLSDSTIVFWADKQTEFEKSFAYFFTLPSKDDPDRNVFEVKDLYDSIYSGRLNSEGDTTFYVLGLAPNAARISVRFWKTGNVRSFAEKIALHFDDLEIVHGINDEREFFSLFNLLANISLEYKIENIAPNLAGKMIESILDGSLYPATLQQQCLRRIRAEQHVNRIRAAILKAYLNRNNRIYNINERQIIMALDFENTNQGYLCGRLLSILEKIHEEAQPGINTTIKDRFYGVASSTPVAIFGRLLSLSNYHIAKLNPKRKAYFEKMLQDVMAKIESSGMPAHLSLDDQSRFAIGYYHQRQDLFPKKEDNK